MALTEEQIKKINEFLKNRFFAENEIGIAYNSETGAIEITDVIIHFYVDGKRVATTNKIIFDY